MCCFVMELWGGSAAGADLPALQHPPLCLVVLPKKACLEREGCIDDYWFA